MSKCTNGMPCVFCDVNSFSSFYLCNFFSAWFCLVSFFFALLLLCTNVVHFFASRRGFLRGTCIFLLVQFLFFHWKESIYKKNKTNGKIEKIWAHPAMENGVFSISNIGLKFISDMSIQSLFVRHFTCGFFLLLSTKNSSSSVCFNPPAFNTLYLMQFLALFSAVYCSRVYIDIYHL